MITPIGLSFGVIIYPIGVITPTDKYADLYFSGLALGS
jgi:hypothetical protein